ncbi:hypothetical protein RAO00_08780, partial [Ornithobacterium rhinotracheale]|uniref:hypothetical protein n=1 Tax=Ornithobacterium rhinotracheale TaxID=28251 RepID=UPI00387320D4
MIKTFSKKKNLRMGDCFVKIKALVANFFTFDSNLKKCYGKYTRNKIILKLDIDFYVFKRSSAFGCNSGSSMRH